MKVGQVWPVQYGTSLVAYSLTIDGRRLDSFIPTGGSDGKPVVLDNGTGYFLPPGTATWDTTKNTVTFHVRRDYLADQQITAPCNVYAVTGYHTRANDWVANDDVPPNARDLDLAAPKMGPETRDAPKARAITTTTYKAGSGSFVPSDSTLGVGLISAVDNRDYVTVPINKQASALVTLNWAGDALLGLTVGGGSSQKVVSEKPDSITVLVPWARRDLTVTVDPQEVYDPTDYTLTVKRTTVVADTDRNGFFDRSDRCPRVAGARADGCPTGSGEKVVALVDGRRIGTRWIMTRHGAYRFARQGDLGPGEPQQLVLKWYEGGKVVQSLARSL